jgi:hypothetical protein
MGVRAAGCDQDELEALRRLLQAAAGGPKPRQPGRQLERLPGPPLAEEPSQGRQQVIVPLLQLREQRHPVQAVQARPGPPGELQQRSRTVHVAEPTLASAWPPVGNSAQSATSP